MSEVSLPDKLSDLIMLAHEDGLAMLKDDRMKPKWLSFWSPSHPSRGDADEDFTCHACLAGAVLFNTMKVDPKKLVRLSDWGPKNHRKLVALEHVRTGFYDCALKELGLRYDVNELEEIPRANCFHFEDNEQFKVFLDCLPEIVDKFRELGY